MDTKICNVCSIEKPLDDFGIQKLGKLGRESQCKLCKAEKRRIREQSKKTPEQIERQNRLKLQADLRIKGYKQCSNPNCLDPIQPLDNFNDRTRSVDGKNEYCKSCVSLKDFSRREKNKEANLTGTPRIIRTEKKCTGPLCDGVIKPISEFHDCISNDDGKMAYCKECNYELAHGWQKNNPDKRSVSSAKHWAKYYPIKGKEVKAKYRKEHPEVMAKARHLRRARIKNTQIENVDFKLIRERDKDTCHICGILTDITLDRFHPNKLTYDHIIPLSRGGSHTYDNIKIACWDCNNKKNNKLD